MFIFSKLRLLLVAMMSAAPLAAGMAQAPHPAAARPLTSEQQAASRIYAQNMLRIMRSDQGLQRILRNDRVSAPFKVGLLVDPNGYVENGVMVKGEEPSAIAHAVLHRLININFGGFVVGMPAHKLLIVVPVQPRAPGNRRHDNRPFPSTLFQPRSIVLYEPNVVLVARIRAAAPLAAYIKQIEANAAAALAALPPERGVTAAIVMGVKPGRQSRAWIVARPGTLPLAVVTRITAAAQAAAPISVAGGPIAFAIIFDAWGGGQPITSRQNPAPFPAEWLRAAGHGTVVPDGIFARIWP